MKIIGINIISERIGFGKVEIFFLLLADIVLWNKFKTKINLSHAKYLILNLIQSDYITSTDNVVFFLEFIQTDNVMFYVYCSITRVK